MITTVKIPFTERELARMERASIRPSGPLRPRQTMTTPPVLTRQVIRAMQRAAAKNRRRHGR